MMYRLLGLVICILILASPINSLIAYSEQELIGLKLRVEMNKVTVLSPFYHITFDLNRGFGVVGWVIRNDRGEFIDLIGGGYPLPSLVLNAYTRDNLTGRYTFILGNRTYTIPLSTLVYNEWDFEIYSNTSELITLIFTPSSRAQVDIDPLTITVTAKFRLWSPSVEFTFEIYNPSNKTIAVRGPRGGPELYLIAYSGDHDKWHGVIADTGLPFFGGTLLSEGSVNIAISLDSASLVYIDSINNKSIVRYIAGLRVLEPQSFYVQFSRGLTFGDAFIANAMALNLTLPETLLIQPGGSKTIRFLVSYIPYNPSLVISSGLESSLLVAYREYPAILFNLTTIDTNELIKNLSRIIQTLKDNLTRLDTRVRELEGLKSYWDTEIKIRDSTIKELQSRLGRQNLISISLMGIGLILGVIGGFIIFKVRSESVRVKGEEKIVKKRRKS
ncbi:MAG: hypothetical protein QXJ70_03775 [Acidilobaceae archaeon]